jgi:CHAD domain-containing protein
MPHKVMNGASASAGGADLNSSEGSPRPPVVSTPGLNPRAPAGLAVVHALRTALSRMETHELSARHGDPEGVHRMRSASRRLRSELRALAEIIDNPWRERVESELKWFGRLLGETRDLDILLSRLRDGAKELKLKEVDRQSIAPLFANVEARRAQAGQRVADSLDSDRYHALVEALEQGALRPPLKEAARLACRVVLPSAAKAAWRRLRKVARDLRSDDPAGEFHEARKRAKRCRYTAELIAPLVGRRAERDASKFIRLTTRVQEALGEHQDALITADELETAMAEHADDFAVVQNASALLDDQQKRACAARSEFFTIWSRLDRKKLRRWMRPRSQGELHLAERPVAARTNGSHI